MDHMLPRLVFKMLLEAKARFPQIKGYRLLRSSDAHRLEEIGQARVTFTGAAPRANELRKAIQGEGGRRLMN